MNAVGTIDDALEAGFAPLLDLDGADTGDVARQAESAASLAYTAAAIARPTCLQCARPIDARCWAVASRSDPARMYHATCVGVMAGLLNTTRDDEKTRHDEVAVYGIATLLRDVGMGCDESMRSLALERAFRACESPGGRPPWDQPSPAQAELGMCLVARAVEAIFGPVEESAAKRGDALIRRYAPRVV